LFYGRVMLCVERNRKVQHAGIGFASQHHLVLAGHLQIPGLRPPQGLYPASIGSLIPSFFVGNLDVRYRQILRQKHFVETRAVPKTNNRPARDYPDARGTILKTHTPPTLSPPT